MEHSYTNRVGIIQSRALYLLPLAIKMSALLFFLGVTLLVMYIFHAGRYLDDKEICYLGTVIVTANVKNMLQEDT